MRRTKKKMPRLTIGPGMWDCELQGRSMLGPAKLLPQGDEAKAGQACDAQNQR